MQTVFYGIKLHQQNVNIAKLIINQSMVFVNRIAKTRSVFNVKLIALAIALNV